MCEICWWEDDGQDDETADEVRGGPNGDLSLTQARYNFARIGASDWVSLQHKDPVPLPNRATGFPFSSIQALQYLPPLQSWSDPWTLSFHPIDRDLPSRWREGARLLIRHGFRFSGVFELKKSVEPGWVHPRFLRFVEYDEALPVERMLTPQNQAVVGAWFTNTSGGGARLRIESVFRLREDWNEPAISIDAYMSKKDASALFEVLLQEWPVLLAVGSRTGSGLRTIGEMTGDFDVTQVIHGTTYLSTPIADPMLLDGFRRRCGTNSVKEMSSGFMLNGCWRAGTDAESEAFDFVRKRLRSIASTLVVGRKS